MWYPGLPQGNRVKTIPRWAGMPPCACELPSVSSGGGQTYMYKWMRVPFSLEPRRGASSHGSLGDRAGGVRRGVDRSESPETRPLAKFGRGYWKERFRKTKCLALPRLTPRVVRLRSRHSDNSSPDLSIAAGVVSEMRRKNALCGGRRCFAFKRRRVEPSPGGNR